MALNMRSIRSSLRLLTPIQQQPSFQSKLLFYRPTIAARQFSTTDLRLYSTPKPEPSSAASESSSNSLRTTTARQLQEATAALASLQAQINILRSRLPLASRRSSALLTILLALTTVLAAYQLSPTFRTVTIAAGRCGAIGYGVVRCMIDYKILFSKSWSDDEAGKKERHDAYEECHTKCAVSSSFSPLEGPSVRTVMLTISLHRHTGQNSRSIEE